MQMTDKTGTLKKIFHTAWCVRTPYPASETFQDAKYRFYTTAQEFEIKAIWRGHKGIKDYGVKDDRGPAQCYHFWEIEHEADAMLFLLHCGDHLEHKLFVDYE